MASWISWLPPDVMHALGWALIHSLWQGLGLGALAALLMALSCRPQVRYLVATVALAAMLAAPAVTFLDLMKHPAPLVAGTAAGAGPGPVAVPYAAHPPVAAPAAASKERAAVLLPTSERQGLRVLWPTSVPPIILGWLVMAWLCGVALFSLRLAGGFLLLERKRRKPSLLPDFRILALAHELERAIGLRRAIRYLQCGWLETPASFGWIRPVILLPVRALTGLSEAQLRALIAHELAHIKRLDPFVNLLQVLVETLLFYHPAIWWLNRRIRAERELCCDEIAISLTGNRIEYAKVLALIAEWERAPVLAMAANRGPLSERIFHILGKKRFGKGQRALGLAGSLLFLAAAIGAANALFGIAHPVVKPHGEIKAPPSNGVARALSEVPVEVVKDAPLDEGHIAPSLDASRLRRREAGRPTLIAAVHAKRLTLHLPLLDKNLMVPQLAWSNEAETPVLQMPVAAPAKARPICASPAIADTVALKPVASSDLKTVPVEINGQPRQFLLDIGTKPTEISQAAVAELGLPNADMSQASAGGLYMDIDYSRVPLVDVGAGSGRYRRHVRVASFTIGAATGHNLAFPVANDPKLGKSKPYDGLLTGALFGDYDAEVDFARNRLNYLTPTTCTDPDQVAYWRHAAVAVIPITNGDGKIQVQVTIGGQSLPAVIDTSSPHTVMRRDIAELLFGLKAGTPGMPADGEVRDGTGQQVYRHTFAQISFAGGVTATNVPALIEDASMVHDLNRTPILGSRAQFVADPRQRIPSLTLGMDVLRRLHLYLVRGQQTLYVTAAQ